MKLPMRGPWLEPSRVSYSAWNQARRLLERVALADFEHLRLDSSADASAGSFAIRHRDPGAPPLPFRSGPALQSRSDEIAGVIDREADQLVELGIALRRRAGRIALDEAPRGFLVRDPRTGSRD